MTRQVVQKVANFLKTCTFLSIIHDIRNFYTLNIFHPMSNRRREIKETLGKKPFGWKNLVERIQNGIINYVVYNTKQGRSSNLKPGAKSQIPSVLANWNSWYPWAIKTSLKNRGSSIDSTSMRLYTIDKSIIVLSAKSWMDVRRASCDYR